MPSPNDELRAQINNYFQGLLPKSPTTQDESDAVRRTLLKFPALVDYYIRYKEDHGDEAKSVRASKVVRSRRLYLTQFASLPTLLNRETDFYKVEETTLPAARTRGTLPQRCDRKQRRTPNFLHPWPSH